VTCRQGRLSLSTVGDKCAKDNLGEKFTKFQYTKTHITILLSNEFFPLRIHQNRCRGFIPDQTGGAYSAPPDPLAGFKGAASRQEENGGEGTKDEGRRGKRGREGKGGWRREGKTGEVGGIAPWLLGG